MISSVNIYLDNELIFHKLLRNYWIKKMKRIHFVYVFQLVTLPAMARYKCDKNAKIWSKII